MAATLQSISLLGTSSPLLAPPCSSGSSSEKQGRSVHLPMQQSRRRRLRVVRAAETDGPGAEPAAATAPEEPPSVDFAFVSPRLLPDGTPDVHYRTACGGQKLRDIMLEGYIDLYGPYDKLLLNCSGGGECGTCIVEVVEGNEMLSPKNEVEKEKLKRKPKTWRLACQATVGNPDSTGQMALEGVKEHIESASADARHQLARKNSSAIIFGRAKAAAQKASLPASLSLAKAPPPPP